MSPCKWSSSLFIGGPFLIITYIIIMMGVLLLRPSTVGRHIFSFLFGLQQFPAAAVAISN